MAKYHVHAIAITNGQGGCAGVVTALDVVAAATSGEEPTALGAAATEPLTISTNEPLSRAAQVMSEHDVSHLIVVDAAGGYPVGIVSTLDIAAAYSGGTSA